MPASDPRFASALHSAPLAAFDRYTGNFKGQEADVISTAISAVSRTDNATRLKDSLKPRRERRGICLSSERPVHSAEKPADAHRDQGGRIGLRLDRMSEPLFQ